MLEEMRNLALDFVFKELGTGEPVSDLGTWFRQVRHEKPSDILPFLVESGEKVERVYTLKPGKPNARNRDKKKVESVTLDAEEFTEEKQRRLPFVRPSGSQSAAVGPILKRTFKAKEKEPGPSLKILETTLKSFKEISQSGKPWSNYFKEIVEVLNAKQLVLLKARDKIIEIDEQDNVLYAAVREIDEKKTVYLAVVDYDEKWPGDRPEYWQYLFEELPGIKYVTETSGCPPQEGQLCPLCETNNVTVYPNAVKGAGINLANMDRPGAFPGVATEMAWKGYALCIDCADLLSIYKNHVSKQFIGQVAGEKALLLPLTGLDGKKRQKFIKRVEKYVLATKKGVAEQEEHLLSIIAEEPAVTNLTILWAKFGQNIENLRGVITDVLPSRLGALSKFNQGANSWMHLVFPAHQITRFDLGLSCLGPLFKRPGGKKAKQANASQRLFQLKRSIASALYRKEQLEPASFWQEAMTTARWYVMEAFHNGNTWGFLNEGAPKEGNDPYLTMAGWVRHMALLTHYLQRMEVLPMTGNAYKPKLESLRPFFGDESGIDTKDKAFAFLLGILYGKVMEVQAARGVNVGANALTWLKRLTLTGEDLPELYNKVREKLLAYETEGNEAVREVIQELGQIGAALGNCITLDETATCYFLLLGQSLTTTILPSKKKVATTEMKGDNK